MMEQQDSCINPTEKRSELLQRLKGYSVKQYTSTDKGYEYLSEKSVCLKIENPNSNSNLLIELEEQGEFTLIFSYIHNHYSSDLEEYAELTNTIFDILENRIGCATLLSGEEKRWLGSTWIDKTEVNDSVKKIFAFVFKSKDFKNNIQNNGGQAEYEFWNPVDNKTIKIEKQQSIQRREIL